MADVTIGTLLGKIYHHAKAFWKDKMLDPEGDRTQRGTKVTAKRMNNLEDSTAFAHERLNDQVVYLEDADRTQKNLRFEFLLLKASVTSGLTSNILVDNFETLDGVNLIAGKHDPELQRIYLP